MEGINVNSLRLFASSIYIDISEVSAAAGGGWNKLEVS